MLDKWNRNKNGTKDIGIQASTRCGLSVDTSQDAKVDLKPLIVAIIPIYYLSETINVLFFLFLSIFN
jgi:hypothetical protein